MYLHPLMDEVLFKILRANPLLQVVLVLPDTFFTHVQDPRHKMNWARKVTPPFTPPLPPPLDKPLEVPVFIELHVFITHH